MKRIREVIIKVQLPIVTNDVDHFLYYDEDMKIVNMEYDPKEVRRMRGLMKNRFKVYYLASVKGENISLIKEVEEQPW